MLRGEGLLLDGQNLFAPSALLFFYLLRPLNNINICAFFFLLSYMRFPCSMTRCHPKVEMYHMQYKPVFPH